MLTPFGFLFLGCAVLAVVRPRAVDLLLVLSVLAPIGAVWIHDTLVVGIFQATSLTILAVALGAGARRTGGRSRVQRRPGLPSLVVFAVWTAFISLAGPRLFAGIDVLPYTKVRELQYTAPDPLVFTTTNLVQAVDVLAVVVALLAVSSLGRVPQRALGAGLVLITVFSALAWLHVTRGTWWPDGFFDNDPSAAIIQTVPGGGFRNRGIASEPSVLAAASIGTLTYFGHVATGAGRPWSHRLFCGAVMLIALYNLVTSDADTALAGAVVAGIGVVAYAFRLLSRGAKASPLAVVAVASGLVVLTYYSSGLISGLSRTIALKEQTTSFKTRTGADKVLLHALWDSGGLGIGLGSSRPYSLGVAVLGSAGVIGAVAAIVFLVTIVHHAWRLPPLRPVVTMLGAGLVTRLAAGSTVIDPLIWVPLMILTSHVWAEARHHEAGESDGPAVVGRAGHATQAEPGRHQSSELVPLGPGIGARAGHLPSSRTPPTRPRTHVDGGGRVDDRRNQL